MQEYLLKLTFCRDGRDEELDVVLYIPNHTRPDMAAEMIRRAHDYLCTKDTEDVYKIQGKSPITLLDYVCEYYGWTWKLFSFDIEVDLNAR